MEDPKKEKQSPELKEELTEEEAKSVDGGGIDSIFDPGGTEKMILGGYPVVKEC